MNPRARNLRAFAALFLFLTLANTALAENRAHSLEPGSLALQFQVDDDFQLGALNGLALALKHHWSDRSAIRYGVAGDFRSVDDEDTGANYVDGVRTPADPRSTDDDSWRLRLDAIYLRYPSPGRDLNWFWGLGPTYEVNRSRRYQKTVDLRDDGWVYATQQRWTESNSWSIGGRFVLGAEWFATESVSLHAEYSAVFTRRVTEASNDSVLVSDIGDTESHSSSETTDWNLDAGRALLGLSVYF